MVTNQTNSRASGINTRTHSPCGSTAGDYLPGDSHSPGATCTPGCPAAPEHPREGAQHSLREAVGTELCVRGAGLRLGSFWEVGFAEPLSRAARLYVAPVRTRLRVPRQSAPFRFHVRRLPNDERDKGKSPTGFCRDRPQHHSSLSSSPAPVRPGSVAWSAGRLAEEKVGRQVHQAST